MRWIWAGIGKMLGALADLLIWLADLLATAALWAKRRAWRSN